MNETTIGKRIQQLRKAKGLTQEALAEQLGVTAQAVSKWENDYACPDISILPKLADVLGVTTDELLTGTQTKTGTVVDDVPEDKTGIPLKWRVPISRGGICFGALVVCVGVILLLSKLIEPFPYAPWSLIWPLMILFVGVSALANKLSSLFGWIVSAVGICFFLNNLDVLPVPDNGALILAALVIVLGIYLVFSAIRHPRKRKDGCACKKDGKFSSSYSTDNGRFSFEVSFGDEKKTVEDEVFRGGGVDVTFGSATLDMRAVQRFENDAVLNADVSFGSLIVLLPKCVRITEEKDFSFASSATHGTPDADAPYVLTVNGDISFGSVDFRYDD